MERLVRLLREFNDSIDWENEEALVSGNVIDSMDVVSLIGELEDEFGIEISMEEIREENFDSVNAMWEMIENLM